MGVVIVTGAGSGIGAATARALAARGDHVVCADIMREAAENTAQPLPGAIAVRVDVSDATSCDEMVALAADRFGEVDGIATCAGIEMHGLGEEFDEADFDRIIDVNLKGTFLVAQAAARRMVRRRRGVIITLSSVNAEVARPESAAYAATKGGVRQLTKAMAIALAPHGIRVNAIGPGTVVTGLTRHLLKNRRWRDAIYARTPMQRVAEPREIAEVAVFLASDASSYMTGSTVYVDGGRLALNGLMPPKGATKRSR